jgi:uncharacterized protein YjbI with pentapeptide repeats
MHVASPNLPAQLAESPLDRLENGITIESVKVVGASWVTQTARRATFDVVHLVDPDLTSAKLRDSGWSDVVVEGGEMSGLDITGSSWRRVAVSRARLSGIIFAEAQLGSITITDAKLDLANFRFATLKQVEFIRCSFTDADFAAAKLESVTFTDCQLAGCDFAGMTAKNVDLTSSAVERVNGVSGLRGVTLTYEQMISLVPELAADLGIKIQKD